MSVVERVARAICVVGYEDIPNHADRINLNSPNCKQWGLFIPEARAAIAAMREPDEAMLKAGSGAYRIATLGGEPSGGARDVAERVFAAMIDDALQGER